MAKKAKVKVKSKAQPKSNRELVGTTKVRTITHIRFNAKGEPRRKGW